MRENEDLTYSVKNRKKMIIAELMDANSHIFLQPIGGASWVALAASDHFPSPKEMLQIDKAIGMVVQVFNQSKREMCEEYHINDDDMFTDLESGLSSIDPNEAEGSSWTRAVAEFNQLKQDTDISENDVIENIFQAIDRHSGQSALSQGVVEAAKQIIQLDLEFAMREVAQA